MKLDSPVIYGMEILTQLIWGKYIGTTWGVYENLYEKDLPQSFFHTNCHYKGFSVLNVKAC